MADIPVEKHYIVEWVIDEWTTTPEEAARRALETQRDPSSIATAFTVREKGSDVVHHIDLSPSFPTTESSSP